MEGNGAWKHWAANLAEATWLVNTRGCGNCPGPAQTKPLHTVGGEKILAHIGKWGSLWISPPIGKDKPIRGIVFARAPGCTWWVMKDGGPSVYLKEI